MPTFTLERDDTPLTPIVNLADGKISLSCAPFVSGYGGIFRRSHSRGYIKAVKELGYSSVHPQQELAVKQFVCGNDVFVCLPTDSEKS